MVLIVLICSLFELSAHVSHVIILHGGDTISLLSTYIISIDLFLDSTSSCPRLESHAIYCCRKKCLPPCGPVHASVTFCPFLPLHFPLFSISPSLPALSLLRPVSHRCLYFSLFPPLPPFSVPIFDCFV